jgi:Glycosyl hydrolase catalytic core
MAPAVPEQNEPVRRLTAIVTLAATAAVAIPSLSLAARADPKRGVASAKFLSHDPAVLARVHPAWAYDWSWETPRPVAGLEWVPMIWGSGSVTPRSISSLTADRRAGRAHYLLGFNEPDSGGQANMSPTQAAALWPRLQSTGLILGSPAPAVPGDGWLDRFMAIARARRLRVDFIALHYYQDFTNPQAVDQLRSQLIAIHRRFGKPIWITEIGALDVRSWGGYMQSRPSGGLASSYMRKLLPMLDGLSFVQRYAWFTDFCSSAPGCPYSALFDRGGALTERGRIYRSQS